MIFVRWHFTKHIPAIFFVGPHDYQIDVEIIDSFQFNRAEQSMALCVCAIGLPRVR